MDGRGWGWTASEIRRNRLVEWIVPQSGVEYVAVGPFYEALPDQGANTPEVAYSDLKDLERRSLLELALGLGGMDGFAALATPQGRDLAEHMQAARSDNRLRRAACRDAMVDWLYSCDTTSARPQEWPDRETMLADPCRGFWFAAPFSADDLGAAAAWLERRGLVKGSSFEQAEGPVRLYLTDPGVSCAENFGSDTGRYVEAQRPTPGSGTSISFGGDNHGQVAGDHAYQVQNNGPSAEHLRELITGIAELVRSLVPDAEGASREAEQEALAAADGPDHRALGRFAEWALSALRAGATTAAVAAVSSAITVMLTEASRLGGHLG